MVDDMTGENVSGNVLVFSDDSDDKVEEPADSKKEGGDEGGENV